MLDPMPIGEPEKRPSIKCSECGLLYEDNDLSADWDFIDEHGVCISCDHVRGDN